MSFIKSVAIGALLLFAILAETTEATHQLIGEPPRFNTQQTVNMSIYETDVNGDRNNLVIPCEITDKTNMSFTWYRGDAEVPADMVDSDGDLIVANITEGEYASRDGVEYHCIATRTIGMNNYSASVRSKTITVYYAFFDGFEQSETRDQFVTVALNSDVAMECDVQAANPLPNIQWLQNGSPLAEVTTANAVRFLEEGRYLYIASVTSDHLQSTFSCRVTNAFGDRVMTAPTTYRLIDNITLNELVEYKQIGDLTAFVGDTNFEFSYVGGAYSTNFNGTSIIPTFDSRGVGSLANIATEPLIEKDELGRRSLSMTVFYDRAVIRTGSVTVYQRPTITSSPVDDREILVTKNSMTYTCEYEGSPSPTIEWFFNGRPISATSGVSTVGNTLTIASPDVSNSGIYQCIVSNQFGQDERVWLIEIRQPILPHVQQYNFTELDAFDDRDLGALFVRSNASTVVFTVEVVADPCPTIQWFFNGLPLTTSNSTFMFDNPCTASGGQSPYWTFTLEVVLMTETSGNYTANLTNIVGSTLLPKAYFTVPEDVSITDFTLLNEPCLKEGTNVSLRCHIRGFPRPTIRFVVNGTVIRPGEGIYENFVVQEYYDQIAILNVNMTADGRYTCIANSGVHELDRAAPESFSFCTIPIIVASEVTPNPVIGGEFVISCTVAGIPRPRISWRFKGETLENSGNPEVSVTPDGIQEEDIEISNNRRMIILQTPGGSTSILQVTDATAEFNGLYICTATNLAGEVNQSVQIRLVQVQSSPSLSLGAAVGLTVVVEGLILVTVFGVLLVCVYTYAKKRAEKSNLENSDREFYPPTTFQANPSYEKCGGQSVSPPVIEYEELDTFQPSQAQARVTSDIAQRSEEIEGTDV